MFFVKIQGYYFNAKVNVKYFTNGVLLASLLKHATVNTTS